MTNTITLKEKLETILEFIPGSSDDIAMMIPCHVNTLRNIKSGNENIRYGTVKKLDELYKKALKIQAVMDS